MADVMLPCRNICAALPRLPARLSSILASSTPESSAVTPVAQTSQANPKQRQQQPESGYKLPPQEITDIVDAPPQPGLTYSPNRKHFLQASNCMLHLHASR